MKKERFSLSIQPIGFYLLLQTFIMTACLVILFLSVHYPEQGHNIMQVTKIISAALVFSMFPIFIWILELSSSIAKWIMKKWKDQHNVESAKK